MIAARLAHAFARWCAAKFTAPDEQRLVPQACALQVGDQRRDGLVGLARVQRVIRDAVVVTVPGVLDVPATGVELDEAHAFLDQLARDQALASEVRRARIVEAIHLARRRVLAVHIDHAHRLRLHAIRQLIRFDPRHQLRLLGMQLEMFLVQRLQQIQTASLRAVARALRRRQIEQRRATTAEQRALIRRRHVARRPVRRTADRPATRVRHHHKARQILIRRAQPIAQPRPQARLADEDAARVHLQTTRRMSRRVRVHRPDHAQVIRMTRRVRKQTADLQPTLSMPRELKRRLHQVSHRTSVRSHLRIARVRLAVILLQRRLRIKRVHLRRPAIHEEKHAMLRLRRKVRPPLRQRRCRKRVRCHQICQRQPREATSGTHQAFTTSEKAVHGYSG